MVTVAASGAVALQKKSVLIATAHYLVRVMYALLKQGTHWQEGVVAA